jgi:hypothetical protein
MHEVLRPAADLPDTLIGFGPVLVKVGQQLVEQAGIAPVEAEPCLPREHDRVDDLAVHVELDLLDRVIADPDRNRALISVEPVGDPLA